MNDIDLWIAMSSGVNQLRSRFRTRPAIYMNRVAGLAIYSFASPPLSSAVRGCERLMLW
jgi:hypothetical protein